MFALLSFSSFFNGLIIHSTLLANDTVKFSVCFSLILENRFSFGVLLADTFENFIFDMMVAKSWAGVATVTKEGGGVQ